MEQTVGESMARRLVDQAKHFTEAFLRGQPHKASTLAAIARDKISQLRA